jgi:cell division protein FtsN
MRKPVYSSRSTPKPSTPAAAPVRATSNTYVQVGTFRDSGSAQKTAQRIVVMGMGARIGKSTRSGKAYLSVQAGPCGAAAAPKEFGKMRGLGYRDAFIR